MKMDARSIGQTSIALTPWPEQKLGAQGPVSSNVKQAMAPARVRTGGGRSPFGFVGVVVRLMGANAIALLTAAVTAPLMARALGPTGRGDVAAVAVPLALTATVLAGGLAGFVGRNVARGRSPALLFGSVLPMLVVLSVAAVAAAAPVADALAPEGGPVHTALLVGLLLTPVGLASRILLSIANFQERWRLTIFQRLLPPGLMLVGVVGLFVTGNLTVSTAVTLVLLSNFVPSLFLLPILWQIGRPRLDWRVTREGLSFGSRIWMTMVAARANVRLDQLLMISLVPRRELGVYAVAVNFTSLLGMFANALVMPLAVRVAQGDHAAAARALRMALVILLGGGAILAALCPLLIPLAFGSDFSDATLIAVLLIVATVPQSGGALLATSLGNTDRPGASAIAQWLALVVTVPALLVVLPRYGGEGAAVVSIAAYSVSFACLLWSARRHLGGGYRDYLVVRRSDMAWMWRTVSEALTRRWPRSPDPLGEGPDAPELFSQVATPNADSDAARRPRTSAPSRRLLADWPPVRGLGALIRFPRQVLREQPALCTLALLALVYLLQEGLRGPALDLGNVWTAGKSITGGNSPYAVDTVVGDFVHPPGTAILMSPVSLLPLDAAGKAVVLLSCVAFVVGVLCSARSTSSTLAAGIGLLAFCLSGPLPGELKLANTDLIAAGFYGIAVLLLHYRRSVPAGLALGLGLSLKPTMALLLLLPLVVGQWRATVAAVSLIAAINLVGMVLVPDATRFFTSALPYITEGSTGGFNVSLKASLDRLGFPSELVAIARVAVAAGLVALLVRIRGPLSRSPALAATALIAATPLVSSYFFAVYFVYLVAATGAIALFVRAREIVLLSAAGFLLLATFTFRASNEAIDDLLALRHVVGALLLILAVAELGRREIRESREPAQAARLETVPR